ncbi:MAG: sugar kinase [Burkholderiaceae bacterium]|nr:sugar kinase [Burkholderiaceae bacterium]
MDDAKRFDLYAIGEPMVEFNQTKPGAPDYLQGFGGDTSNMAIAAARSGARVAYGTRVGDDTFGRMFVELWLREKVDVESVAIDPDAHTGVYFVSHGPAGHEFSYLRRRSAASRMRPQLVTDDVVRASRIVHASGISMAISSNACDTVLAAFEFARSNGTRISFDSNLRTRLWPLARARAMIGLAASLADWFFPSLEDARALSGRDDPDALVDWAHGLGARVVFLKLGADGVIVSDGVTREHIAGHEVATVDATGAGDCFCGACLARIAAGDSIRDAARYANAAAALSTTGYGAVAPLPRPQDVRRLLARAGD